MSTSKKPMITIIGAGLTGTFLAILLAKRGYHVQVYERFSKKEIMDQSSKRSFNLTFYGYGVEALKQTGLWEVLVPHVIRLRGSVTQVTKCSEPIYAPLDKKKMPYYTISRAKLLQVLIDQALREPSVTFHFDTRLLGVNRHEKTIDIQNMRTKRFSTIPTDVVLGTDGVNSQVRSQIQQSQETHHSQEYARWSYKQIILSRESVRRLQLRQYVAYTWSRKEAVIASFPNSDGSITAILVLPQESEMRFSALRSETQISAVVEEHFPHLMPALADITQAILTNSEGYFATVHTAPWYYKDFMAILGDSAHGFPPFFGQGMSAAFGDCLALTRLLDKYGPDWEKIFPLYQEERKKHMDTLGDLSTEGFIRYRRYKKADYAIIYDRFESLLHHFFPKFFLPALFTMVSNNPDHTYCHVQRHQKQRKLARFIGLPVLVSLVTGVVALQEKFTEFRREKTARKDIVPSHPSLAPVRTRV